MLAYDRYPTNRSVVHSLLCELSIEMEDVVSAVEYYKQFVKLAPKDKRSLYPAVPYSGSAGGKP